MQKKVKSSLDKFHYLFGWGNGYLPFLASENSRQSIVARQPSYLFETFHFSLLAWTHDNPWFTRAVAESKNPKMKKFIFGFLVEATGLEPTTSWSLTKRATKLRYASIYAALSRNSIHSIIKHLFFVKRFLTLLERILKIFVFLTKRYYLKEKRETKPNYLPKPYPRREYEEKSRNS